MTKAVSNREICFIKAVLLLCEHGHFFYHTPTPNTIRVKCPTSMDGRTNVLNDKKNSCAILK